MIAVIALAVVIVLGLWALWDQRRRGRELRALDEQVRRWLAGK